MARLPYEAATEYPIDTLRKVTDRIVLVLVGQPRGTTLKTWKRYCSDPLRESVYPKWWNDTNRDDVDLEGWNWAKGCPPEHRPIIDIVLVVSEYDTPDRYMNGEDPRLAGLDPHPYYDRYSSVGVNDWLVDLYNERKFPINKNKWEAYQKEIWSWADSLNFIYWDDTEIVQQFNNNYNKNMWHTTWANQFLHFSHAVKQLPEIFKKCTNNSVVIRQRYDISIPDGYSFWHYAKELFYTHWSPAGEEQHHTHHAGFDISPKVVLHDIRICNGHINACDESTTFDGEGAQVFGEHLDQWLLSKSYGLSGADPKEKAEGWFIPEMVIPKFCLEKNYTFLSATKQPPRLMSLIDPPLSDQWRYHWYDDWTPELVQEMRIKCNLA